MNETGKSVMNVMNVMSVVGLDGTEEDIGGRVWWVGWGRGGISSTFFVMTASKEGEEATDEFDKAAEHC